MSFGLIGGLIGNSAGSSDRSSARDRMSEAVGAFRDIKVPTIEEQRIQLEMLKEAGLLTPELEAEILMGPSAVEGISTDPALRQAQMEALSSMQERMNTGLTSTDRAQLNQMRQDVARGAQANEQSILQNMAQRGISGGGNELAARLQSSQSAANRQSTQSDALAAMANQRALEATSQAGILGGNLRSQDFNEANTRATAKDAISRFNTQNRQDVQQRNIGVRNQAQQANLTNKQNIMNQNVGLRNDQEKHNKGLYQSQFNNEIQKAAGLSSQLAASGQMSSAESARKAQMGQTIGSGMDQTGMSIASLAMMSDETAKKNVRDGDSDVKDMLDKVAAKKYEYKEPEKYGQGEHVSVMAQDLEKSDLGKTMVIETPEGKMVDYAKGFGTVLASQASINKRMSKIEQLLKKRAK